MQQPQVLIADRYRLVEQVGSGGMGVVWRAEDERLHRPVAVKLLRPPLGLDAEEAELATQRAMREARITARLHHPHAVAVFDVVEHEGRPCLVMQYLPSVPLSTVLREGGPLQLDEAARLGAEVASALAAAHQLGIVHRDVKPGNILVAEDGSAMLSDFGISRVLGDATLTVAGMVHGTPAYLAPEVARGASSDASTDVYSLGATLYAALEGSPPFGNDPNAIALLHLVAKGEFAPPRRSGPMAPLLLRMLAVDPAARPRMPSVAAELSAIRTALAGGGAAAPTRLLPVPPAAAVVPTVAPTAATPVLPVAAAADQTALRAVPVAPPAPPARPPAPQDPAGSPRRRGRVVVAVLAVLVLLAGITAFALSDRDGSGTAVPPASASASASETSAPSTSASESESESSEPSESSESPPSPTASSPAPTPTLTPSATASTGATESQLASAVTDYYALLPKDTGGGWAKLTGRYQRSSGGRAAYDRFWGQFSSVTATKASGTAPDKAEATISYLRTDGSTLSERRSFTLVADGGVLKIDRSALISGG